MRGVGGGRVREDGQGTAEVVVRYREGGGGRGRGGSMEPDCRKCTIISSSVFL